MRCSACFNILLTSSDVFQKLLELLFHSQRGGKHKNEMNNSFQKRSKRATPTITLHPLHKNMKKRRAMALITCPDFRFARGSCGLVVNVHKWSVRPWPHLCPSRKNKGPTNHKPVIVLVDQKICSVFHQMFKNPNDPFWPVQ